MGDSAYIFLLEYLQAGEHFREINAHEIITLEARARARVCVCGSTGDQKVSVHLMITVQKHAKIF
jgi:hypothetical protein